MAVGSENKQQPVVTTPNNITPIADAGADISIDEQTLVTLSGNATDSDGSIASYLWTQTSGTSVTLSDSDKAQASFTAPDISTNEVLTFSFTVTDNDGAKHSDGVNVQINHIPWQLLQTKVLDIDRDGVHDLLYSQTNSKAQTRIIWSKGQGNGEFASQQPIVQFNQGVVANYQIEDVNNDGLRDVVVELRAEKTSLDWIQNLGEGLFSPAKKIATYDSELVKQYQLANVDSKNGLDLVTVKSTGFDWYKHNEDGSFAVAKSMTDDWVISSVFSLDTSLLPVSSTATQQDEFRLVDVTGDAFPDLVMRATANNSNSLELSTITYAANLGDGKFASPIKLTGTSGATSQNLSEYAHFYLEDINNDGVKDIVTGVQTLRRQNDFRKSYYARAVYYWFNAAKSEPEFGFIAEVLGTESVPTAHFIDWNQDGKKDLIIPSYTNPLTLAYGEEKGPFSNPEYSDIALQQFWQTIDIDRDGSEDFVINVDSDSNKQLLWQRRLVSDVEPAKKLLDYKGTVIGAHDFDNDGHMEFVSNDAGVLYWYKNNGDLTFTEKQIEIAK